MSTYGIRTHFENIRLEAHFNLEATIGASGGRKSKGYNRNFNKRSVSFVDWKSERPTQLVRRENGAKFETSI